MGQGLPWKVPVLNQVVKAALTKKGHSSRSLKEARAWATRQPRGGTLWAG